MAKISVKPVETLQIFDYKAETDKEKIPKGCIAVMEGYATFSGDKSNKNKHFYPGRSKPGIKDSFWDEVLTEDSSVKEKLETKTFFGSTRHPDKDASPIPEFGYISHNIRSFDIDDKGVKVVIDVFDTEQGRELKPIIDYGSKIGISTRAYGEVDTDKEGFKVPIRDKYHFVTWDFVTFPAFSKSRMDKISDTFEIELDDSVFKAETKEQFVEHIKKLKKADARILCDYMGVDFVEVSDSFDGKCETGCVNCGKCKSGKTDIDQALDQALDTIVKLEKELEDQKSKKDEKLCKTCGEKMVKNDEGEWTCGNEECGKGTAEEDRVKKDSEELIRLTNSVQYLKEKSKELQDDVLKLKQNNLYLKDSLNQVQVELQESQEFVDSLEQENRKLNGLNKIFENKTSILEKKSSSITDSYTSSIPTTAGKRRTRPLFLADTKKGVTLSANKDVDGLREVIEKV